jgi:hypothetical protein
MRHRRDASCRAAASPVDGPIAVGGRDDSAADVAVDSA